LDATLKRIRELTPKRSIAARPDSFFYKFEHTLAAEPGKLKMLGKVEDDLACLDEIAWNILKAQAARYLAFNKNSGWDQLFNTFNEAKGHRYLQSLGCTDIAFLPTRYDRKTPDLIANLNGQSVLCEIKTISATVGPLKFVKILNEAKAQLDAYDPGARKIIYVILNETNKAELEAVLKAAPIVDVEVERYTLLRT
jgi:hypothetical protein